MSQGLSLLQTAVGIFCAQSRNAVFCCQLQGIGHVLAGIPAVLLAVGAVVTARITAARRFAAYAMVLLLAGVVTAVMHWRPEVPMLVSGTGVSLSGLVLVVRFLRASADFASDLDE